jgi:disulfide bond formation protein DsbB
MAAGLSPQRWLLGSALVCFAAVGAALVSQHVYDMQPCPWCILQRLIFVVIGIVALFAAFTPVVLRRLLAVAIVLLCGAGIAAALYQHFVAGKSQSCNLTLADRIIVALKLDTLIADVFSPRANCADAAVDLLGVPYTFWSLALFALFALVAVKIIATASH